jgi:hypothetical protein
MRTHRGLRIISLGIITLPTLCYFALFLVIYDNQFLQRRDESNIFMTLRLIEQGAPGRQIFLGTLSEAFMGWLLFLNRLSGHSFVIANRVAMMCLGFLGVLVTGLIARRLTGLHSAFLVAAALVMSSRIFVWESTNIRANLPALVTGLLVLYGLLSVPQRIVVLPALTLGALFAFSLQLKLLSVMMLPACFFLLWPRNRKEGLERCLCFGLGFVVATSLLQTIDIGMDLTLKMQLPLLLGTSVLTRLKSLASLASDFLSGNALLVYTWILGAVLPFISLEGREAWKGKHPYFLAVWLVFTVCGLSVNYPTWNHHFVFLVPPLAVSAAYLLSPFLRAIDWRRREAALTFVLLLFLIGSYPLVTLGRSAVTRNEAIASNNKRALQALREKLPPESLIWTDDHVVTLSGGYTTSPELSEMSWKRNQSGFLSEQELGYLMFRDKPAAIVVASGLFDDFPAFIRCLEMHLEKTSLNTGGRIYWTSPAGADRVGHCLGATGK